MSALEMAAAGLGTLLKAYTLKGQVGKQPADSGDAVSERGKESFTAGEKGSVCSEVKPLIRGAAASAKGGFPLLTPRLTYPPPESRPYFREFDSSARQKLTHLVPSAGRAAFPFKT